VRRPNVDAAARAGGPGLHEAAKRERTSPQAYKPMVASATISPLREAVNWLHYFARWYASAGWAVFPCYSVVGGQCNCWRGADCEHSGKHPRTSGGFRAATTDALTIDRWWRMWPLSNVAIATGTVSGLVVIDIDPRNGAFDTIAQLAAQGRHLPPAALVSTPSGGFHLYFRHPGGKVPSRSNGIGAGIDVKADGGYVLAPPSVGLGGTYRWQRHGDGRLELGVL
jgi:hypothetical protein